MYCDDRCKKRGWRRRRAGLAEDELAGGGRRGRVVPGALTAAERRARFVAELGMLRDELRSQAASLTSPATRSRVRQLLEEDPPRLAAYDAQLDEIRQGLDA
jgi:hypothetical protein